VNNQAPIPTLLLAEQEAPLAPLDRLPRALWLGGLTHSQGTLVPRLADLEAWRTVLLAGGVPLDVSWPPPGIAAGLFDTLRRLDLPGYCADRAELADTVLQSLLFHFDLVVDYVDRGASEDEAVAMALEAFAADWSDRCGMMDELVEVFGDLGDLVKNTRWDTLRGLLRSSGWQEVVRVRKLIERLPELAAIIRGLGRARRTEDPELGEPPTVPVMEESTALRATIRRVRVPDLPGETRGVRRSGRVARMLPAEALLLAHPRLRLVWHARHAERALLTYEDDDRMNEVRHEPVPAWRPSRRREPDRRLEMGPMLVCVDTSGSMQGGAEAVAKATVLEAARAAHAQGRACHVFAFGGQDEVVEMELAIDSGGVERLTRFLGQTFRGGTDICGPLDRMLARLEEARWQLADILIASDGEFGATPGLAARVAAARAALGLRVQGVLIGDRETIGLLELADDIFWVRDWRRYGGSDADSPVHSKSLTANYFPGALRSAANRDATVSGATAAEVMRGSTRDKDTKP